MGGIKSTKKYLILYGESGSGKTLFLYNLKSSINTFGVYISLKNRILNPQKDLITKKLVLIIMNMEFSIYQETRLSIS